MADKVNHNFVEKYIITEILEKVYRLKSFIGTQKPLLKSNRNKETIEVFQLAFTKVLHSLKVPISVLRSNGNGNNQIRPQERIALNRSLSTTFHLLTQFHAKLKYVYSDWVRPETYTFTKNLLKNIAHHTDNSKLNIILSDEYTFKENDLVNKFNEIFKNSKISPLESAWKYPTFFLPKVEYTNPLNWSILAHEVAHINEQEISMFVNDKDLMPPGTIPLHKDILKRWATEIYCDLFALNFLGPAYFASFVSFAFATTGLGENWMNSSTHPSNMYRIRTLHEHITRNNVNIPIAIDNIGSFDMSGFFSRMIEDFDGVYRQQFGTLISPKYVINDLTHFNDFIIEKSRSFVGGLKINEQELEVIDCLQERLEKGITIGSHRQYNKEKLLTALDDKDFNFDEIKSSLSERGTSIREILNAGWINKVSNLFPEISDLLLSSDNPDLDKMLPEIGKLIDQSDDRLLKSIETSELYFLMEIK